MYKIPVIALPPASRPPGYYYSFVPKLKMVDILLSHETRFALKNAKNAMHIDFGSLSLKLNEI